MVICCAAPNCTNRQGKGKKGAVSFHRFPLKDAARLDQWTSAIQRIDWIPGPYSFLCSDHFSLDSFIPRMPDQHPLLRPNAVPSLFKSNRENRRQVGKDKYMLGIGKRKQKKSSPCSVEETRSLQKIINKHGLLTDIVGDDVQAAHLRKPPSSNTIGDFIYSLHSYSRTSSSLLENEVCVNGPPYLGAEGAEMTDECLDPAQSSQHLSSVIYDVDYFLSEVEDSRGLSCYIEVVKNTELASIETIPSGLEETQTDDRLLESCEVYVKEPCIYIGSLLPGHRHHCMKMQSDRGERSERPCKDQSGCMIHGEPPLNPAVEPLAWMLGTWVSDPLGEGEFPSISSFRYKEEVVISHVGQPILNFMFSSSNPETGKPMHRECGFIRLNPGTNQVAFMCAQNLGVVEVEEGEVQGEQLTLTSCSVSRMSFAKAPYVQKVSRTFRLTAEGKLEQIVSMATSTQAMAPHLRVTYKKVTS